MDLETGEAFEPVDLRFGEPPAAPETPEGLAADQRRLFETLRDAAERREAARVRREADRAANTHDVVGPVYLPPRDRETGRHLSPNGRWMLVEVAAARPVQGSQASSGEGARVEAMRSSSFIRRWRSS